MDHATTSNNKPYVGRPSQLMITEMIAEYEDSQFTVEEYCEYKGLNPDTFQSWLTKQKSKELKDQPAFVPVAIKEDEEPSERLFVEYRGLKFYQRLDVAFLKALIS